MDTRAYTRSHACNTHMRVRGCAHARMAHKSIRIHTYTQTQADTRTDARNIHRHGRHGHAHKSRYIKYITIKRIYNTQYNPAAPFSIFKILYFIELSYGHRWSINRVRICFE